VKAVTAPGWSQTLGEELERVPGVLRVIKSGLGPAARLIEEVPMTSSLVRREARAARRVCRARRRAGARRRRDRSAHVEIDAGEEEFVVRAPDVGCVKPAAVSMPISLWLDRRGNRERGVELGLIAACIEKLASDLAERGVVLPRRSCR